MTSVNPETGSPDTYSYDANGNMTCRVEGGITFKQDYNAENRISAIHKMNGTCSAGTVTESWLYGYDGDGVRVSTAHYTGVTQDSLTVYYMGGAYEVTGSAVKKYYSIAGQTIMRDSDGSLKYLLTDHLGSTSAVVDGNGTLLSQQRYLPFGEVRAIPNSPVTQTDFGYTFQRNLSGTGLMDYKARMYSVTLGRFIQPDSIIPNPANPQSFNRFGYVLNNPVNFTDPTGHRTECGDGPQTWANCKKQLKDFALKTLKDLGGEDDLEAVARIVDKAADIYENYEDMIPALSGIFLGIEESNSLTVYNAANYANACAAVGRSINDCPANIETGAFGDTGFHQDFQDGFSQPFHFWAYLATAANTEGRGPASYLPGMGINTAANVYHEILRPDGPGATWQDFALAVAGSNIGTLVNFRAVRPDQLGNTIRDYVGSDSPGAPWIYYFINNMPLEGNSR